MVFQENLNFLLLSKFLLLFNFDFFIKNNILRFMNVIFIYYKKIFNFVNLNNLFLFHFYVQ